MSEIILGEDFPWYATPVLGKGPGATLSVDEKYNLQLCHVFFNNPTYALSPTLNIIEPLLEKLEPMLLIKAKANLNLNTNEHIEHGFHCDISEDISKDAFTAVYYLNTNNGYTKFEDGTNVESVANRIVIFPRQMMHTGSTCTDKKSRTVINLNFIKVE